MSRRQFATLGVAGAAHLAFPKGGRAQQPQKLPRIGWLLPEQSTDNPSAVAGYRQGLVDGPIAMSTLRPQLNQLGRLTR